MLPTPSLPNQSSGVGAAGSGVRTEAEVKTLALANNNSIMQILKRGVGHCCREVTSPLKNIGAASLLASTVLIGSAILGGTATKDEDPIEITIAATGLAILGAGLAVAGELAESVSTQLLGTRERRIELLDLMRPFTRLPL